MPRIIVYTVPLCVARLGNLWKYCTGHLESRGGRVKRVAHAVLSQGSRRDGVYRRTIIKRRKKSKEPASKTFMQTAGGEGQSKCLTE
eukprot:5403279-Pleurochrysis_carterae.AAC.2